jgi:hypothetical protein
MSAEVGMVVSFRGRAPIQLGFVAFILLLASGVTSGRAQSPAEGAVTRAWTAAGVR